MRLGKYDYAGVTEPYTFASHLDDFLRSPGAPSAKAVAQEAGIGETELSRIRRGLRVPNVHIAARIAAATGLTLDELTRDPSSGRGAG